MSEQEMWEELVRAEEEYVSRRRALFAADAEAQLAAALASPHGKGTALRVLIDAPIELVMELVQPLFQDAASSHPQVGLARRILGRVDSGWLAVTFQPLVAERLDRADVSWEDFRRVAELLSELHQASLLQDVVRRAELSDDEDIQEVAADFRSPS